MLVGDLVLVLRLVLFWWLCWVKDGGGRGVLVVLVLDGGEGLIVRLC